jgi:PPOX class probable F420-dependent enzyme
MRLTDEDARVRLASVPVVHLATADAAGRPHVVVATFAPDFGADPGAGSGAGPGTGGDRLYTAVDAKPKTTRDLRRLRNIHENPRVAVLADHYEDDWTRLWWVRADATAEIVEDPDAMARPIALLRERYPQYREAPPEGPVIAIAVERWSGWAYAGGKADA